jgi:hypothetical protein
MNCPKCEKEMENGYIHAAAPGLFWNNEEYSFNRGEPINDGLPSINRIFTGAFFTAYRCRNCQMVVAQYKDKKL